MQQVQVSGGTVVPFRRLPRESRPPLREDEPRGAILLFTGVRYERMPPSSGPQPTTSGQAKAGRRRPRS